MKPDVTSRISTQLASRSSRRAFLSLASASALTVGFWLTGSGISYASHINGCADCNGGPCPTCFSPVPACTTCRDGCSGGGCASGYSTSGTWWCCIGGCQIVCSECKGPSEGCCHCFTYNGVSCDGTPCAC